jgi:hypothetical protein
LKVKTRFFEDEIRYLENYQQKLDKRKNEPFLSQNPNSISNSDANNSSLNSKHERKIKSDQFSDSQDINFNSFITEFNNEKLKGIQNFEGEGMEDIKHVGENEEEDNTKLIDNWESEKRELANKLEILRQDDESMSQRIQDLIESAEKFENEHNANLTEINSYENQLLEIQNSLKQILDRKEMYERKLDHMRGFSVLNEAFNIEITDQIGKINGLEIGLLPGDKEPNWVHVNSAFGSIMLIYSYLIRVNGIANDDSYPVEICAFGYNSYFNDTNVGKKYFLMGPVSSKNLVWLLGRL